MDCNFRLSKNEIVEAMQLHGRGSKRTLIILGGIGVILLLIGILTQYKFIAFGSLIGGIVGYFITMKVTIPYRAKKQYLEYKALHHEISMTLLDQGITFSSESGESRLKWNDFVKWKSSENICLLYITSNMFHIVPLSAISSDDTSRKLISLLSEHVGPKKTQQTLHCIKTASGFWSSERIRYTSMTN